VSSNEVNGFGIRFIGTKITFMYYATVCFILTNILQI